MNCAHFAWIAWQRWPWRSEPLSEPGPWISLQLADLQGALRQTQGSLPPHIRLRAVDLDGDVPRIADVYNAAFGLEGRDALTAEQVLQLTWHPGLKPKGAFLAYDGERAVGLAVGSVDVPVPGGAAHRGAVEVLAVQPDYQQRGIGRALLHAVLSWHVEQGVKVVVASVEAPRPLAILRHYGFTPLP
jgi:GNAT superfamily N-acetyltransferase